MTNFKTKRKFGNSKMFVKSACASKNSSNGSKSIMNKKGMSLLPRGFKDNVNYWPQSS